MVGMAVMAIGMVAFSSMMKVQQNEVRALSEKLASLDLEKLLITTLANGSICTALLSNSAVNSDAPYTIDASSSIDLSTQGIPASDAPGAPSLIRAGDLASTMSPTLKVGSIKVSNFTSVGSDRYLAEIQVSFDSSSWIRPIKPIKVKTAINTAANVISGCDGGGAIEQFKYLTGSGCGSCPHGSDNYATGPPLNITTSRCRIKIHDGSTISSSLLGSQCYSSQVGNQGWAIWTY